jgi:hypothetical protein
VGSEGKSGIANGKFLRWQSGSGALIWKGASPEGERRTGGAAKTDVDEVSNGFWLVISPEVLETGRGGKLGWTELME